MYFSAYGDFWSHDTIFADNMNPDQAKPNKAFGLASSVSTLFDTLMVFQKGGLTNLN